MADYKDVTWTLRQEIALIKFWRENVYLWQTSHMDYHRKDVRSAALQRVCEVLGNDINGVPFTAATIKKKIKHLRDMFMRESKRIDKSKQSGDTLVYSPKWTHFNRLQFFRKSENGDSIEDEVFPPDTFSPSAEQEYEVKEEVGENGETDTFECFTDDSSLVNNKLSYNQVVELQGVETSTPPLSTSRSPLPATGAKRPKRTETPTENDEMFCKAIQVINDRPRNYTPEDVFGMHVANTLKTLGKKRQACLKLDIQQLLFKYEIDDEGTGTTS